MMGLPAVIFAITRSPAGIEELIALYDKGTRSDSQHSLNLREKLTLPSFSIARQFERQDPLIAPEIDSN
jgi:hypothetical protein